MIDLVLEEQRLEHLTGLSLEQLLQRLEQCQPGALLAGYERIVDRYLVLCGKGHRQAAEQVELDRLDSGLRVLLGSDGVLACAGHLVGLAEHLQPAIGALSARPERRHLELAGEQLLAAVARCRTALSRPPVPVDQQKIQAGLERAATLVLAALRALPPGRPQRWLTPGWQRRGWLELYRLLVKHPPALSCWQALESVRPALAAEAPTALLVLAARLASSDSLLRVEAALNTCAGLVGESLSPSKGG